MTHTGCKIASLQRYRFRILSSALACQQSKRRTRLLYHAGASKGIANQAGGKWRIQVVLGRAQVHLRRLIPMIPLLLFVIGSRSIHWFSKKSNRLKKPTRIIAVS
jgi:hypothetical protein